MADTLTFIHAADLHIGAPFRGLRDLSPSWSERLRRAIIEAYGRVVDAAIEHSVDFVLMAGDIFDEADASYRDYVSFFEGLERLSDAGISSYLCTGNHDPYVSWEKNFVKLPERAYMMPPTGPGYMLYERKGRPECIIVGRNYYNSVFPEDKNVAEGLSRDYAIAALGSKAAQAPFGVGILHTGLSLDPRKAPADPEQLKKSGIDYWALGHIHRRWQDSEDEPRMAFSGCIQGRDILESGKRGINLVTLSTDAPPKIEFIPTASVVWERISVDISSCQTLSDAQSLISREQFRINGQDMCEEMVTRVTLTGQSPLHSLLSNPETLEMMREELNGSYRNFYCDALIDHTTKPRDYDALRREGLFPATFLRTADRAREKKNEQVSYLLKEFTDIGVEMPKKVPDEIDDIINEAASLVMDLIMEDEK
ncbi:MAG: DNA repair exonuclease [Eggerthellaceae bacterium]|nr:DNA repair exonuclease [Eggerthellaceae bacterium]